MPVLAALPMAGFFIAMVTRKIYGGTFSDSDGILSLIIKSKQRSYAIDLNLVAETAGFIFLLALTLLFQHASSQK